MNKLQSLMKSYDLDKWALKNFLETELGKKVSIRTVEGWMYDFRRPIPTVTFELLKIKLEHKKAPL